jgi:hypothetical protein
MRTLLSALEYPHVQIVNSGEKLLETPNHGQNNLVLFPRELHLDFQPLADILVDAFLFIGNKKEYKSIPAHDIKRVLSDLAPEEPWAINQIMQDMSCFPNAYLQVTRRHDTFDDFHVDGSYQNPFKDRIMCVYTETTTEFIESRFAKQDFCREHRRTAYKNAPVYAMPQGAIWKHSCSCEPSDAEPFVHKSPSAFRATPDNENRLMLVMDIKP